MWQLLDRGLVRLNERVADIIPEFDTNGKNEVTIEHILTHRAGFPFAPLGYPKMLNRHDRLSAFGRWKLDYQPGTKLQFHLTSAAWVIAEIIERRAGMPIAEYISSQISEPLGLTFQLGVPVLDQGSVAEMIVTDRTSESQEVDPWGPWYLSRPEVLAAGEPSHSLVGSAADLALFYQAANDGRICSPVTLVEATRARFAEVPAGDQLYGGSAIPVSMGLFVTVSGEYGGNWMPTAGSPRTWGHGGAAYQLAFIDPDSGISMACLSNGYPLAGYDYSDRGVNYLTTLANLGASLAA
jgi:CubicO group peptidase (beta-lactamase class C family)